MIMTQFNLYNIIYFYKYGHNLGPWGSADMILGAFDVKFLEKQKEIHRRACGLLNKFKKNQQQMD